MTKSRRKRIIVWLCVIFLILVLALFGISEYMLSFALQPKHNKGRNYQRELVVMKKRYPWIDSWIDSVNSSKAMRDTSVIAADGDRHHAIFLKAQRPTVRTAVIIPGYTDCAIDMLHIGYIYNKVMGMNILIPDLHGNGKSDGDVMQMGWKDRLDVIQWIKIADSLYRGNSAHASIVLHGQSMGAATTMCVSGEQEGQKLVKCFVEDCGYTSAWDEFSYELHDMFGLHDFPVLYSASALCKVKYGWSFGEVSPLNQVAKCHKPMLFIHGGSDTFVPTEMVYRLYSSKQSPKELVVFHGSSHARSYMNHRIEYEQRLENFVNRYL